MRTKLWAAALAAGLCANLGAVAAGEAPSPSAPKRTVADTTWIKSSLRHSRFLAFTENGQLGDPIVEKSGHGTVRAIAGTVISTDGGQPTVHSGCVKVICDRGTITIRTRVFTVNVPDGATALIESFPAIRSFRVAALAAPNRESVSVTYKQARLPIRLTMGEMVTTEADYPTTPAKFDAKAFAPEDQPLLDGADASGMPSRITAIASTQFKCMSSGALAIREGECLVQTGSSVTVFGPAGAAAAKKNALMDVEAYTGDFRIKSLSGPGHVSLEEGEQSLPIHPGQEMFVAQHVIEDSDKTPPDGIGRRRFDQITLKDGTKAIMSDFSMMSFLNADHMVNIRRSTDPVDRDIIERILKTAAAVQNLTQSHGIYTQNPRRQRIRKKEDEGPSA